MKSILKKISSKSTSNVSGLVFLTENEMHKVRGGETRDIKPNSRPRDFYDDEEYNEPN